MEHNNSDSNLKEVLNGGFGPGCLTSTPPTVNLMRLYKEIVRSELCKHTIESIYKLCDHHLTSSNYVEAGFTLKLHADKLNWTWDPVPPDAFGNLVQVENCNRSHQFEWQLKENLYMTIIEYFDRAKCWEEAIPLMKELAEFYEKKIFDYFKWSHLLKNQSLFLENILNQFRPESEYFRVGFYGCGFPAFLRNKVFIYRGLEFEKIAAFTERLQTEFPMATLITKSGPPEESIHEKDGQFMQVVSVKPVQEPKAEFDGKDVPDKVITYYLTNNVKTFISDRPLHKGQVDKENEFKSLWIERSTLTIADKLPGILRWSEVVSKKITELSPIEHACETVESMIRELQKLIVSYSLEPSKPISPLSMRLQGVIEAAVNGGVAKYQDAFFNVKYIHLHPEQGPYIRRLKQLILQKVRILEGGLSLHGRLAPTNIQPLQRRLLERLTLMRQNVMEASSNVMDSSIDCFPSGHRRNPSIIHQPLPPIPVLEPVGSDHTSTSLPIFINDGRRRHSDTQAPNISEQNGNFNGNNNYHDVIYAVPAERNSFGTNMTNCNSLPAQIDGMVLTDGNGGSCIKPFDPTSPPPLPPKRPKRPRSSGMSSSSIDRTSQSPTMETPPPRPPIPAAVTSPNIGSSTNCNNNENSSQFTTSSIQRSRSIPRSNNSFQLSNLISSNQSQSNQVHDPGVNGNLYTPSPTRSTNVTNSSNNNDLTSPEVPPRAITHILHPMTLDRPRATPPKEVLNTNVVTTNPKVSTIPDEVDGVRPVLPPKTVRKTISSNQLDAPAVLNTNLNSSSTMNRISNVTSITVNGTPGHKTSTLPNRRPPPPTPPLSSGSPPPPHHPPPPAPPLSSAEESELLSMSIASNLSLIDDSPFVPISSIASASPAIPSSTSASSPSLVQVQQAAIKSNSSQSVSVITVNSMAPSALSTSISNNSNSFDTSPTTIIRVTGNTSSPSTSSSAGNGENVSRRSSQSTASNSSTSSNNSCPLTEDIKGV